MFSSIPWGIAIGLWLTATALGQVVFPPAPQPNFPFSNDDAANNIFDQMQRDDGLWPDGSADDKDMSDADRRRLAAQQAYFSSRLTQQQCETQITQLENTLATAGGDRKAQIERQIQSLHMQRRSAELQMAIARSQWPSTEPQADNDTAAAPFQTRTDELRHVMGIRQRLSSGDRSAIQDALKYLRQKYGLMPEGFSAYDWLAGSEEFGSAIRNFVIMEAERIRIRLREGDETAIKEAWSLWQFIHISDFWFRRYPDIYIALTHSDLFANAMREFLRKKIQDLRDGLEDGDKDALKDAIRFWQFVHAEMFQFREYPDWHDLFSNASEFADAYRKFLDVIEEDLRRRLREGDPDAIRQAASHLRFKEGDSVGPRVGLSDAELVSTSTEFGNAYQDGFGGK